MEKPAIPKLILIATFFQDLGECVITVDSYVCIIVQTQMLQSAQ